MVRNVEERIPPQALDAEMAVLGSMLLDAEAVNDALETLKPEHFYKEAHHKYLPPEKEAGSVKHSSVTASEGSG